MKQLNKSKIQKLNRLNQQLILIEEQIYIRAKEQNEIALKKLLNKEHSIWDYELEAVVDFYSENSDFDGKDDCLVASLTENMKAQIMHDDRPWGINDKQCHNTTAIYQKDNDLNAQKHCWLLHCLYDHYDFTWENIFCIDNVYFDIAISYQYRTNSIYY